MLSPPLCLRVAAWSLHSPPVSLRSSLSRPLPGATERPSWPSWLSQRLLSRVEISPQLLHWPSLHILGLQHMQTQGCPSQAQPLHAQSSGGKAVGDLGIAAGIETRRRGRGPRRNREQQDAMGSYTEPAQAGAEKSDVRRRPLPLRGSGWALPGDAGLPFGRRRIGVRVRLWLRTAGLG